MRFHFNTFLSASAVLLLVILVSSCGKESEEYYDPRGPEFAGAQSCTQCHKNQHELAAHSAHALAMTPASLEATFGKFDAPGNEFRYTDGSVLKMEEHDEKCFQAHYVSGEKKAEYPFDLVFGNRRAQTGAFWHNGNAYELPLSWYVGYGWATSPGYKTDRPNFERRMIKDCFACHSSNTSSSVRATKGPEYLSGDMEDIIRPASVVYGIDCERCHGPAGKHVAFHKEHPTEKQSHGLVAFSKLTRQQRLDACAVCHSGADGFKLRSRFEFRPGDKLEDYYRVRPGSGEVTDVHGNQYGLLIQSQCFLKSQTLDCSTCHSGHGNVARNDIANSKSCNSCHNTVAHTPATQSEMKQRNLANNCIECHMPKQGSQAIRFQRSASAAMENYILRTHLIGVYKNGQRVR